MSPTILALVALDVVLLAALALWHRILSPGRPAAPGDEAAAAEIVAFLRERQNIDAIKRYRQATGLGLKEVKDVIDRLRVQLDA